MPTFENRFLVSSEKTKESCHEQAIKLFGLLPLPNGKNGTDGQWHAYLQLRSKLAWEESEHELQEGCPDICSVLWFDIQSRLDNVMNVWDNGDDTMLWRRSVYVSIIGVERDEYSVASMTVKTRLFSPYAIPKMITMKMRYNLQHRWDSIRHSHTLEYHTESFDGSCLDSDWKKLADSEVSPNHNATTADKKEKNTTNVRNFNSSTVERFQNHLAPPNNIFSKKATPFFFMKLLIEPSFHRDVIDSLRVVDAEKMKSRGLHHQDFPESVTWLDYQLHKATHSFNCTTNSCCVDLSGYNSLFNHLELVVTCISIS
jgi:hypothetical protein